jgi:hypothetical protein
MAYGWSGFWETPPIINVSPIDTMLWTRRPKKSKLTKFKAKEVPFSVNSEILVFVFMSKTDIGATAQLLATN